MDEYRFICTQLNEAMNEKLLTAFTMRTVMEMSDRVLVALAKKYSNIKKGVKSVMGGTVIEHEAKKILDEGISIGRSEGRNEGISIGRSEGRNEGKIEFLINFFNNGGTDEQAMTLLCATPSQITQARRLSMTV